MGTLWFLCDLINLLPYAKEARHYVVASENHLYIAQALDESECDLELYSKKRQLKFHDCALRLEDYLYIPSGFCSSLGCSCKFDFDVKPFHLFLQSKIKHPL